MLFREKNDLIKDVQIVVTVYISGGERRKKIGYLKVVSGEILTGRWIPLDRTENVD